ncbi:MAG: NAD(P)H-dependent oxidoreductase subunit E, partial [Hyphomicrobiales bacterium]
MSLDRDLPSEPVTKRRPRARPKGRQVDPAAEAEIRALLGAAPRRRDLLIEHLHAIQDRFGQLSAAHIRALAEEMRLAEAEVFEVASFYHHFDIVKEGAADLPPLTLRVCASLSCMLAGADALAERLAGLIDPARVRLVRAPCMGRCDKAPAVLLGRNAIAPAGAENIAAAIAAGAVEPEVPTFTGLEGYRAGGGYLVLDSCRAGARTPEAVIAKLTHAGLRGLGGAGFPAGRKWQIVRDQPAPRFVTVNADEGEPGTFKDRHYLETDPHRVLEGALIAAWAVAASRIYIYLRDEYPHIRAVLAGEIARLDETGLTAGCPIELRRGAGAYVCGEESAMLESIEGKRGLPRNRPPYIAETGLFGRPTLNHNVETLYWVRDIIDRGPDWFAALGTDGHKGLRSYSVSGRVRNPGVHQAPAGISLAALIDGYCGGMAEGHSLAAFLPGGASGGIFPAAMAGLPLDFGTFEPHGGFVGSHAVIVLSDRDDLAAVARNLIAFFADESCGQCTPCRVGTEKLQALIAGDSWDEALIAELAAVMRDASI